MVFRAPVGKRYADEKRVYAKAFLKKLKEELDANHQENNL